MPILLTCVFSLVALRFKTADRDGLALLCALLAGMSLGLATMIRLPSFLLSAGFLVLLWPGFRNFRIKSLPVVFALGVTIAGVIPVVINQHKVAGAWYLTTYSRADAEPPTLKYLGQSASYFLVNGDGSVDNWALVAGFIGLIGFLMLYVRRDSEHVQSSRIELETICAGGRASVAANALLLSPAPDQWRALHDLFGIRDGDAPWFRSFCDGSHEYCRAAI